MKHPVLALVLAATFVTALVACGREAEEEVAPTAAETQTQQRASQTEVTTTEAGTTTYFGSGEDQPGN
ncbi:MAG: hypothetical protein C0P74_002870 [Gammaproteobacteria bacterium]|nr:hypothetical protein [Gammaproteobacteria bacterium]